MERNTYQNLPCAYGSDTGGCHTLRVLQYLRGRFGPVASFSGSYRADSWTLQISRQNSSGVLQWTYLSRKFTWHQSLFDTQAVRHQRLLVGLLL